MLEPAFIYASRKMAIGVASSCVQVDGGRLVQSRKDTRAAKDSHTVSITTHKEAMFASITSSLAISSLAIAVHISTIYRLEHWVKHHG